MKKYLNFVALLTLFVGTACGTDQAAEEIAPAMLTTEAAIGDLLIRAEATGTVEPVREVEVRSKASGEILQLLTDIGEIVRRGTLLAEIDPRDVRNRYNQTQADLAVAQAQLDIAQAQLERQQALLEADVITQSEFESATLSHANAEAALVRAQTNFELAELQLADVSIRAPLDGTIIQKNVEEGTVIQSAASNVSGGTALFVMANLDDMQVRTLVDETDMGDLEPGLVATVSVEAYPDRTFMGVVDKIEPQAVVVQNVTMFPVIVSIDNRAGLLKPGMNAEVEVQIDEARSVIVVPNNAIVQPSDIGPASMALGLNVEEMDLSQFMARGRGSFGGGRAAGGSGASSNNASPERENGRGGNPRAQFDQMRAQVESGEITQDSLRKAIQSMRAQSGRDQGNFGRSEELADDGAPPRESRPAVVFVLSADSIPEPRLVQMGLGDWDNTEIVGGLEEGETLVIVGAAQLQAQRDAFMQQMRGRSPFGGGRPLSSFR